LDLNRTVAKGLGLSVLTGYGCSMVAGPVIMLPLLGAGFLGSMGCLWRLRHYETLQTADRPLTNHEQARVESTFWTMCASAGLMLTPALSLVDPWTVPLALGSTGCRMLGFSHWAQSSRANPMVHWKEPLLFGLVGLVGLDLAALVSLGVWGSNAFASAIMSFDLHFGLVLFSALSAYDTHVALEAYRNNPNQNTYLLATNLFWSLLNFFLRLLELISKVKK